MKAESLHPLRGHKAYSSRLSNRKDADRLDIVGINFYSWATEQQFFLDWCGSQSPLSFPAVMEDVEMSREVQYMEWSID